MFSIFCFCSSVCVGRIYLRLATFSRHLTKVIEDGKATAGQRITHRGTALATRPRSSACTPIAMVSPFFSFCHGHLASAVLTYVATVAWPQGPAHLGAPRFCRPHFQNLLCAFSSARHVHHDESIRDSMFVIMLHCIFRNRKREIFCQMVPLECAPRV